MEYVEGTRLDQFVDQRALGLNERLTLFRKLCAAVAYAHQHLVIHRDIKPANIRQPAANRAPRFLNRETLTKCDDPAEQPSPWSILTPGSSPNRSAASGSPLLRFCSWGSLYELLTGTSRSLPCRSEEIPDAITEQTPARPSST